MPDCALNWHEIADNFPFDEMMQYCTYPHLVEHGYKNGVIAYQLVSNTIKAIFLKTDTKYEIMGGKSFVIDNAYIGIDYYIEKENLVEVRDALLCVLSGYNGIAFKSAVLERYRNHDFEIIVNKGEVGGVSVLVNNHTKEPYR